MDDDNKIYNYALNRALNDNDYEIIDLCLSKNFEFSVEYSNVIGYVTKILIDNDMMNYGSNVGWPQDGGYHSISYTKKYDVEGRYDPYELNPEMFKIDECIMDGNPDVFDEIIINNINKLVKFSKMKIKIKLLKQIQIITNNIDLIFNLDKYDDKCIPYLLEYYIFNNNSDNVNILISKMENPHEIIKRVILDNLDKNDDTCLKFIFENNIYVSKDLIIEILKNSFKNLNKFYVLYCVNLLDKKMSHEIIIDEIFILIKYQNYAFISFLFENGLINFNDFWTIDNSCKLCDAYFFDRDHYSYYIDDGYYIKKYMIHGSNSVMTRVNFDIVMKNIMACNNLNHNLLKDNFNPLIMNYDLQYDLDPFNYNSILYNQNYICELDELEDFENRIFNKVIMYIPHFGCFCDDINTIIYKLSVSIVIEYRKSIENVDNS